MEQKRNIDVLVLGCFISSLLCGCALTPYRVEQIDYNSPQAAATILVSDPQVYARASLINDRRSESEYLKKVLTDSADTTKVKFSPQILRDLKTVEVLSASLGLSFNKTAETGASTSELNQQIQAEKLKAQLAVLEKQIEGINAASAPTVTIPQPDLSAPATPAAAAPPSAVDVSALNNAIKDVKSELAGLVLKDSVSAPSNNYAGLSDPRDDFIDRQAYRRDIRAALSEAQLDDVHDHSGNALYRLQFQVTALPPSAQARQWGVVQLSIDAPIIDTRQISSLYINWLSYLSKKLNSVSTTSAHDYSYDRYVYEIGNRGGLFDVVDVFINGDDQTEVRCFWHSTARDDQLTGLSDAFDNYDKGTIWPKAPNPRSAFYRRIGTYAVPPDFLGAERCLSYTYLGKDRVLQTTFSASNTLSPDELNKLLFIVYAGSLKEQNGHGVNVLSTKAFSVRPQNALTPGSTWSNYVPSAFCELVVEPKETGCPDPERHVRAAGGYDDMGSGYAVQSYSVLPIELAQRLGVTTESSQALQTALTVAAQVSAATQIGGSLGHLRQSDARAEALARQPLVVGFSGSEASIHPRDVDNKVAPVRQDRPEVAHFGWLLGPAFAIEDSNTLKLQQGARNYGVSADVSFPGWWSYLDLSIETAWAKNWSEQTGLEVIQSTSARRMTAKHVAVPATDASFESLTSFIAARQHNSQYTHIFASSVIPNVVPACAGPVTFQISGANIWRAESVYLGAAKATEVTVLPDMNGISATFDVSKVFGDVVTTSATLQVVPLTVSAQQGEAAPLPVYVVGQRQTANGATTCQSNIIVPTTTDLLPPTIVSVSPQTICSDAKSIPLLVQGFNLPVASPDIRYPPTFASCAGPWPTKAADSGTNRFSGGCYDSSDFKASFFSGSDSMQQGVLTPKGSLKPRSVAITITGVGHDREQRAATFGLIINDCGSKDKGSSSESDNKDATDNKKVTLISTTVKADKDQGVTVKATIPQAYYQIVIAVRPTSPKNAAWIDSAPISTAPGTAVELKGALDLSKISAKAGDKLEVVLKLRLRPDSDWQQIPADKQLSLSAS